MCFEIGSTSVEISNYSAVGNCVRIVVRIPIAVEDVVHVRIEMATGQEISKYSGCTEICNSDCHITIWKMKCLPCWRQRISVETLRHPRQNCLARGDWGVAEDITTANRPIGPLHDGLVCLHWCTDLAKCLKKINLNLLLTRK